MELFRFSLKIVDCVIRVIVVIVNSNESDDAINKLTNRDRRRICKFPPKNLNPTCEYLSIALDLLQRSRFSNLRLYLLLCVPSFAFVKYTLNLTNMPFSEV